MRRVLFYVLILIGGIVIFLEYEKQKEDIAVEVSEVERHYSLSLLEELEGKIKNMLESDFESFDDLKQNALDVKKELKKICEAPAKALRAKCNSLEERLKEYNLLQVYISNVLTRKINKLFSNQDIDTVSKSEVRTEVEKIDREIKDLLLLYGEKYPSIAEELNKKSEKLEKFFREFLEKKKLISYMEQLKLQIVELEKSEKPLDRKIETINEMLTFNSVLIQLYESKYPTYVEKLRNISNLLIKKKASLVMEEFWKVEEERIKNFEQECLLQVEQVKENLEEYLKKVRALNSEAFKALLFSYRNLYDYVKSDDKLMFLKDNYENYFLSESMLEDALNNFFEQYSWILRENQNNFLQEIVEDFVDYEKSIGDIVFIPDLSSVFEEVSPVFVWQKDVLYLGENDLKSLNSIVKKIATIEVADAALTFTPFSPLMDGGTIFYEKKLESETDKILLEIVEKQLYYVWVALGLNDSLNNFSEIFVKQTVENSYDSIFNQYISVNANLFLKRE